jgi:hypothetical protein
MPAGRMPIFPVKGKAALVPFNSKGLTWLVF